MAMYNANEDNVQSTEYIDAVIVGTIPKPDIAELLTISKQIEDGDYYGIATIPELVTMAWALGVSDTLRASADVPRF